MGDAHDPAPQSRWKRWREWLPLAALSAVVVAGAVLWFADQRVAADLFWGGATVAALLPAAWWMIRSLRHGRIGVDVIAVLALATALLVGEYLAGAVVALMLATGQTLDRYAQRRATRDLRALLARAPRSARRRTPDGGVTEVPLDAVGPGDRLLVGSGEVVPVDGYAEDPATLDESVVTGESQVIDRHRGDRLASGVVNAGAAFGMRAAASAAESTYAGIVRLAAEANANKAPMVRIADRYAAAFVPFTLVLAAASWALSGEFVRVVAVLVVATPCPLLLATPIAIVSGLSRAARRGVLVRDGASLELLGRAGTLLLDKTGTLTAGRPQVAEVVAAPGSDRDELLRLAASVEQLSPHVLGAAIVRAARDRHLPLVLPERLTEEPGQGVAGWIDGRLVRVGQPRGAAPDWAHPNQHDRPDQRDQPDRRDRLDQGDQPDRRDRRGAESDGVSTVWVSMDDTLAGVLFLHDPVRPDAQDTVARLRRSGFTRLVMLTGDRPETADRVARLVGVDDVMARCSPEEKVARVRAESERAVTVMVGDGVNDAPALAAAGVGVAMGATGATASADVADAVLSVDRLDRLADAVEIARRSRAIAVQSATVGMGLAMVGMLAAAFGFLPPVAGAFLQEGIDVAVILNALRALTGGPGGSPPTPATGDTPQ